jgi:hypothetical protein
MPLLFCRENDIALVIGYVFHDEDYTPFMNQCPSIEDEPPRKKAKPFLPQASVKRGVLEYSRIKLPASMFGFYLAQDCEQFLTDCTR